MKKGFTLAEVLITLAIIGVVAALTIPAVIKNYSQIEYKTRFKKVYSALQISFQKTQLDYGAAAQCYYMDKPAEDTSVNREGCPQFFIDWASNLKAVKYCSNEPLAKGCIPEYDVSKDNWHQYASGWLDTFPPAWVFGDGSILIGYGKTAYYPIMMVDINGKKAPNRAGYDVFSFYIRQQPNGIIKLETWSYINSVENGITRDSTWMLKESFK